MRKSVIYSMSCLLAFSVLSCRDTQKEEEETKIAVENIEQIEADIEQTEAQLEQTSEALENALKDLDSI